MTELFKICDCGISVEAERFPQGNPDWTAFEADRFSHGIKYRCVVNPRLPDFSAREYGSAGGVGVFADGKRVYRKINMGVAEGVLAIYDITRPDECTVFFTDKSFDIMAGSRYLWDSLALPQLLLLRQTILLHSSYVDVGGKALLFSAPCGTGKSTQAELWRRFRQAEIINGDKAGLTVRGGVRAHGVPFCGTSGICKNRTMPVGAIVFLSQSSENTVRPVGGVEAMQGLMANTYLDFFAPEEQRMFVDAAIAILNDTPAYFLSCTPDERAVAALENVLITEGVV